MATKIGNVCICKSVLEDMKLWYGHNYLEWYQRVVNDVYAAKLTWKDAESDVIMVTASHHSDGDWLFSRDIDFNSDTIVLRNLGFIS